MAGDNTSPKVRMLLTIGIVAVCLLVTVKFALESYWLDVTEAYERNLLPKTTEIEKTRAAEQAKLEKGAVPISVAMVDLATKGRDNASAAITPQPSDDPAPLVGWAQIKHTGPMPTLAPVSTAPPPGMDMDAGAAMAPGDAGTATATGDAGARPPTAKDGGAAPRHAPAADGGR